MRDLIFRGQRCDNGEWVYGFYVRADHHWHNHGVHKDWIICGASANGGWFALHNKHAVKADTVGQYTGLTDKNGTRVFEGDIVDILSECEELGVIAYEDGAFVVNANGFSLDFISNIDGKDVEVIGNVWDNPELIGERKGND